jgi:putative transposase
MISYLCKIIGVSRSGYYNYFSLKSQEARDKHDIEDDAMRDIILKAYNFKRRKKGARQIKMTLTGKFNTIYNLKRIRRIMKKYAITCPIRKANPYRRMMKATKEHTVLPNLLNREFKQNIPGKVLLTDITYLFYGNGKKAYLSTIKDGSTNEILAYNVSGNLRLDIVTDTIIKLKKNRKIKLTKDAFIHSDQGVHYTSPVFQRLVKNHGLGQSMSRRGNCWDNAPQESFFGHFKDEAHIKPCETLENLKKEIKDYMAYYNNHRYQWNLKKMTPVQYRNHLLNSA